MSGIVLPTLFVLEIKLVGYCMSVVDEMSGKNEYKHTFVALINFLILLQEEIVHT